MPFLKKYRYMLMAVVALLALFYWIVEGGDSASDKPFEQVKQANMVVKDTSLVEEKDGQKSWILDVGEIEIDRETDLNMLKGVKGKLFGENGETLDITAKGGTFNPQTREIVLTGDVLAVYSKGWTLKCQKIQWIPNEQTIIAKDSVECEKEGLYIAGDEIQTDPNLVKIKVTGNGTVIKRS